MLVFGVFGTMRTPCGLMDGKLSVEVGGKSPSTNDWAYTFLSFFWIEPVE
jgi:hypothetical protein